MKTNNRLRDSKIPAAVKSKAQRRQAKQARKNSPYFDVGASPKMVDILRAFAINL